ncbi:MAG TPA: hypothetical protein VG095_08305 [Chthoniobacterales bacterium]|nr:hypothetical protein [Chthoniobacterales bacterium]
MTSKQQRDEVLITLEEITLRFGEMEPVVIPRATLRTRLQLIAWVYRLTGWPGMNVQRLRAFIAAVSLHHGWALPDAEDDVSGEVSRDAEPALQLESASRA